MTPKEKAKELLDTFKFADIYFVGGNETMLQNAKNCALLCVDEIIDTLNQSTLEFEYWEEVKEEINKL